MALGFGPCLQTLRIRNRCVQRQFLKSLTPGGVPNGHPSPRNPWFHAASKFCVVDSECRWATEQAVNYSLLWRKYPRLAGRRNCGKNELSDYIHRSLRREKLGKMYAATIYIGRMRVRLNKKKKHRSPRSENPLFFQSDAGNWNSRYLGSYLVSLLPGIF